MTDFLLRGSAAGEDLTVEQINAKVNACLDWGRLRTEGITLREAVLDADGAPPSTWQVLAEPHQTEVLIEGVNGGFVFVECYQAAEPFHAVLGGVAHHEALNGGALRIRLLGHDDPWMVRVTKP